MTADKLSSLVPRLRFPEFEEKAAWSARPLTKVVRSISSGLSLTQTNGSNGFRVTRIETIADGTVDINRVGRVMTDQDISSYRLSISDILVSNINSISHIGKSVLIDRDYDLYHGMNLLRIEVLSDVIYSRFLYYWLNTEIVRASIRSRANKAVNQASINQTELGNTVVLLPLPAEQQKIADCLSSLDDLIATEGRKLDALRQHKQGLIQQLFPQPGETVPRLRFPEFEDAPEWEEERLGNLVTIMSGKSPSHYALFAQGDCAFVKVEDLNNCSKYQMDAREYCNDTRDAVPTGSIVFPKRGAAIENNKIRITASEILIDTNLMALAPRNTASTEFLYYYLVRVGLAEIADTSSIPQINNKHIIPYRVLVPSESEQHRIADCLSMLDARLAAQVEKLNALKTHKQGLLQQIFPPLES